MNADPSLELDDLAAARARVAALEAERDAVLKEDIKMVHRLADIVAERNALEAERDRWREVASRFLDACAGTYDPELAEQAAEMFDELKAALAAQEETRDRVPYATTLTHAEAAELTKETRQ